MSDFPGRVVRRGKPEDRVLLGDARPPPLKSWCDICRRNVFVRKIRVNEVSSLGHYEIERVCGSCGSGL